MSRSQIHLPKSRPLRIMAMIVLGLLFVARVPAQTMPSPPAAPALSPEIVASIYQNEIGPGYVASDLPKLESVHDLIEQYFASDSLGQRRHFVDLINASALSPQVIGKLTHIRSTWSALTPGVYFINDRIGPSEVRYFLGIPDGYDVSKSWPMLVKLPTANAFLTTPPPSADDVVKIYTQWMNDELNAHPDAIVLMPLLNLDELYGPGPVGMNLVIQPLRHAMAKANIDPARVYLSGHSMAAHAVWNLAIHFPTYFAAINPMAGAAHDAWQRYRMSNLRNILSVVWADTGDSVVRVAESRELVAYLRRIHFDVDYTETVNLGHMPPPTIVESEYQKMRVRTRELYPKEVIIQSNATDTAYNRADWVQIYQPLDPGQQIKMQYARGSQGMYLYAKGFRVQADITDPHTITLQAKNVQLLRLYFNAEMVDMVHPVKVIANGLARFDGMLKPDVDEMLKDQLFLGRGWRNYSAVLDLDLSVPTSVPSTTKPAAHAPIEYIDPNGERKVFVPSGN